MNPPLSYFDPASLASIKGHGGHYASQRRWRQHRRQHRGGVSPDPGSPHRAVADARQPHRSTRSNSSTTGGNASFSATSNLRMAIPVHAPMLRNYKAGGGRVVKSTFADDQPALQMAVQRRSPGTDRRRQHQRLPEQGLRQCRMDVSAERRRRSAACATDQYQLGTRR